MLPPRATQRIKIRLVTALVNAALNKHLKTNIKMKVAPPFKLLTLLTWLYGLIWLQSKKAKTWPKWTRLGVG